MSQSHVIKVADKSVYTSDGNLNPEKTRKMLDRALLLLTGATDVNSAWRQVIKPSDRVGIKANCLGGKALSSNPVLADTIAASLIDAGIAESNIIIWERSNRELKRAGYKLNYSEKGGLRCFGTDTNGVGYGSEFHQNGKVASLISRIYEEMIDKNINFPILKDHSIAGLSGSFKNMYGLVHNPNKYHPDNCNPYAAELSALPIVRQKNVLTICDMTTIQYDGGPGYVPYYVERPGAILIATDPVALDTIGYRIIEGYRKKNGLKTLKQSRREPLWIETAANLGLGENDPDKIEFIERDLS